MREQTAEFCSVCHKVHLDVPVNHYRWIRGFNEYDNWQASGVSGQGARSFYYPPKAAQCADCHMPLTPVEGHGQHQWHRALASLSRRRTPRCPRRMRTRTQLKVTENFLKNGNSERRHFRALAGAGAE